MSLIDFDFLNREGTAHAVLRSGSALLKLCHFKQGYPLEEVLMSRRRRRKRVNKVFVSRGGIRL